MRFLSLDGIRFAQPVPIGSLLRLTSYVLHSTSSAEFPIIVVRLAQLLVHVTNCLLSLNRSQHVAVTANVVDVETGNELTTNEFRFTWCRDDSPAVVPRRTVVPKTYKGADCRHMLIVVLIFFFSGAMLWLEGKRALEIGHEIRWLRTKQA